MLCVFLPACDSGRPDEGQGQGPADLREQGAESGPPNILIILTDDQRADTMQVMPATRRIFGRGGTRFKWGVATTPLCCPSRASIFSGKYAHNHGVRSNSDGKRLDPEQTMQHELQALGYETAIAGRYLNAFSSRPPFFDKWAITQEGYFDATFNVNGKEVAAAYDTTFVHRMAKRFLVDFERSDNRPWMLEIAPFAPHRSALAEPKYKTARVPSFRMTRGVTEADLRDKPAYVRTMAGRLARVKAIRSRQLRTLLSVDDLVDGIFRKLDDLDETQNTLAFFLSDNGFMWREHGLAAEKRLPYDESVMVPFYVRWPGHVEAGAIDDNRIVANIDIAPTVYAATGISPSYTVDGRDILSSQRKAILIEGWADSATAIPTWRGRWAPEESYVRYLGYEDAAREYYGPDDPQQLVNLYGDGIDGNEPDAAERWDAWLRGASRCAGVDCP